MDAAEGVFFFVEGIGREAVGAGLTGGPVDPAAEEVAIALEEEVARGLAMADDKGGVGFAVDMVPVKPGEVDVAEDVCIVDKDGVGTVEQRAGMEDAASGVEEFTTFVADVDVETEVLLGSEEVDDLLTEVVDVDGDVGEPGITEAQDDAFEHGNTAHGHEGLGHGVGQGAQAGAETGGEDEGFFHLAFN